MRRCYVNPCPCGPDAPPVGSMAYGISRAHTDAGDLEALRLLTGWMHVPGPVCHPRFGDGEWYSAMGRTEGVNSDGARFYGDTLGEELRGFLYELSLPDRCQRVLVGGDWSLPEQAAWVKSKGYDATIPWCPAQIFVNGIEGAETAEFFKALLRRSNILLVCNIHVAPVCRFLNAKSVLVQKEAAWEDFRHVLNVLSQAPQDATVLYAAGMTSKAVIRQMRKLRPDLSNIDVGHIFDGAFGIRNRSWQLGTEGPRWKVYRERFIPVFLGERSIYQEFGP